MSAIQHVTIPNSTLRRFLNTKNEVFYLDIPTKEIKPITVDTSGETPRIMYNTKKEEFSNEADTYIKEIEEKLGTAYKNIENLILGTSSDFRKKTKFEEIKEKYKEIAIKAVAVQTMRNPDFRKLLNLDKTTDAIGFKKIIKIYQRELQRLNFNIAIIHKKDTNLRFVLPPSHCIFYGESLNSLMIFIILSPCSALVLQTDDYADQCIKNDVHNCVNIKNDTTVNCINHSALIGIQHYTNQHLIGDKNQLQYIIEKELK